MVHKSITYSLPVLKTLVQSESSCVYCFENCQRCFSATPAQIQNLKAAMNEHLVSKVTTYDSQLHGIIMSHKNIKVINSVQLGDDGDYRLEYFADIYIFKPCVGNILTGRVNKKSQDHVGVLVHSVFNATLPRPRVQSGCPKKWQGANIKIGETVSFEVVKVNFSSRLPYIKGKLIEIEERDTEDGDSGFGGPESAEEEGIKVTSNDSIDFDSNDNAVITKRTKKKKKLSFGAPDKKLFPNLNLSQESTVNLQKSKLEEFKRNSPDIEKKLERNRLLELASSAETCPVESIKLKGHSTKKRKRKSSLFDLENSLVESAFDQLKSPEISDSIIESQPKIKRRKMSLDSTDSTKSNDIVKKKGDLVACTEPAKDTGPINNDLTNTESVINNLINAVQSSLKKKKKRSSVVTSEEIGNVMESQEHEDIFNGGEKKRKKSFVNDQDLETEGYQKNISLSDNKYFISQNGDKEDSIEYSSLKKHKKKKSKECSIMMDTSFGTEPLDKYSSLTDSVQEVQSEKVESLSNVLKKRKHKKSLVSDHNQATDDFSRHSKSFEETPLLQHYEEQDYSIREDSGLRKLKKKKSCGGPLVDTSLHSEPSCEYSILSEGPSKKIKKKKSSMLLEDQSLLDPESIAGNNISAKKHKKNKYEDKIFDENTEEVRLVEQLPFNDSLKVSKKKKKKSLLHNISDPSEAFEETFPQRSDELMVRKKKSLETEDFYSKKKSIN